MIVIKGNLIINGDKLRTEPLLRQAQNRASSETSSEQITCNIVAYANLEDYDISDATILEGDINAYCVTGTVIVTGEVVDISKEVQS